MTAPFSKPVPSLAADEAIRKRFGLGRRVDREHQPWYLYATGRVDLKPLVEPIPIEEPTEILSLTTEPLTG